MSVGINSAPLTPDESDARLALGIFEESKKISPDQVKQKLRTLLEKSNEMYEVVVKDIDLDRRVEIAVTRALNCLELQTLEVRLRENLQYRPSFINDSEHTTKLAKTVNNKTVTMIVIKNWKELQEGIVQGEWQQIQKNVVVVSDLWMNLKQNAEKDLEAEANKLVGNSSFGFVRKNRIEKLYAIMSLPNDSNAILKQVSKANRPIASRFPEVCKTHAESCGEMLRKELLQGISWNNAISNYQQSMKKLDNKLSFLSQAEEATRQTPVSQSSLENATHIKDATVDDLKTIDRALHQVMREIYTWSDGIKLNGEPLKIITLIEILGIPLNDECKKMTEAKLAKHLAANDKGFVDEEVWKTIPSHLKKSILQHLFCFTATMIDTVPVQRKFLDFQSDVYSIQINQSKGTEKEEGNRELYRPYTGEFSLKRSSNNASGFEITGFMEKTYPVVLSEDGEDKQSIGTVKGSVKLDSNQQTDAQVLYRFEQLQKPSNSELELKSVILNQKMQVRLEESVGLDVKGTVTGIVMGPDSAIQRNAETRSVENTVRVNYIAPNTDQGMQQLYTLRRTFVPNQEGGWGLQSEELQRAGDPRALSALDEDLSGERLPQEPDAEIDLNKARQFGEAEIKYFDEAETKYFNEEYDVDDMQKPPVNIHTQEFDNKIDT